MNCPNCRREIGQPPRRRYSCQYCGVQVLGPRSIVAGFADIFGPSSKAVIEPGKFPDPLVQLPEEADRSLLLKMAYPEYFGQNN